MNTLSLTTERSTRAETRAGRPWRILVAERRRFSPAAVSLLQTLGEVVLADLSRSELLAAVVDADVLWVRLRHQIDAEVLEAAGQLQFLLTATTGLNHVDLEAAGRHGVEVLSLRGEADFLRDVRATAEHTLGLMLALLRRLPEATRHVAAGGWDREQFVGRELCGMTVGLVGYGRLGRLVGTALQALGAEVLACDPAIAESEDGRGVEFVSLDVLLRRAELVSLHAALNDRNRGFFGAPQFAQMRRGAWFVNTARGELVDEGALLEALRSGQLTGAAVDVLRDEQSAGMHDHPLVAYAQEHTQLLITPHIGGCTVESTEKTEVFLARKLCAAVSRRKTCDAVGGPGGDAAVPGGATCRP